MDIQPGSKWGRAKITFDTPRERFLFGRMAGFSLEKYRHRSTQVHGAPPFVLPISKRLEGYPKSVEYRLKTVSTALGNLVSELDVPNTALAGEYYDMSYVLSEYFVRHVDTVTNPLPISK